MATNDEKKTRRHTGRNPGQRSLPTYNRGWILEHAVESVLAQNYTNLELDRRR